MSVPRIIVVADIDRHAVSNISFELLGLARSMVAPKGGEVICAVVAPDASALAAQLTAADRVVALTGGAETDYAPEAMVGALERLVEQYEARAVLVGSTAVGIDVGPMLAARNGWPLVGNCVAASVEDEQLLVTANTLGGKLLADLRVDGAPAVLLVLPGQSPAAPASGEGAVEVVQLEVAAPSKVQFETLLLPEAGDVDISKESCLIAVGRGIGQEDNMEVAEELATALHGQLCASRPVVDQGWLPATRQVGKSGMVVKPKCYLALGVSGAPEHVEGMADSDLIIAVNTDPQAPIFDVAHYGVVEDLLDVAEAITEALQSRVDG